MSGAPGDLPKPAEDRGAAPKPLSGRDLQENASEGRLETPPGSDADQAAESPHVG